MTLLNPPLSPIDALPIRGRRPQENDIPLTDKGTFATYTCHTHRRPIAFQTWATFLAHREECRQGVDETPGEEHESEQVATQGRDAH